MDQLIEEAADEAEQTDAVEEDVSTQGPPAERQSTGAGQRAGTDDEHDVEDGGADDRADSDIAVGDEHSDDAGKQFRGAASGRHQSRAGHVLRDAESDRDDLQRRDKVLVADDRQSDEHIDHAGGV